MGTPVFLGDQLSRGVIDVTKGALEILVDEIDTNTYTISWSAILPCYERRLAYRR